MRISVNHRNLAAGLLFVALGFFFGLQSLRIPLGTTLRMGPGYFPLILSALLIGFGLATMVSATRADGEPIGALAWRGMVFILLAPVAFGLTVRGGGFVPAVFIASFIAALATPRARIIHALLLAEAVTIFSTLVFSYGLGLPFRRFGTWLNL